MKAAPLVLVVQLSDNENLFQIRVASTEIGKASDAIGRFALLHVPRDEDNPLFRRCPPGGLRRGGDSRHLLIRLSDLFVLPGAPP